MNTTAITDLDRAKFLEKLVQSSRATDGVMLTEWELEFIGSYQQYAQYHRFFTEGRRTATDRMWMKHGSMLDLPFASHRRDAVPPAAAKAYPDCCMYLKRDDDRRLVPCNEPAVLMGRLGFLYCQACADEARKQMKRKNINMSLQPYEGK